MRERLGSPSQSLHMSIHLRLYLRNPGGKAGSVAEAPKTLAGRTRLQTRSAADKTPDRRSAKRDDAESCTDMSLSASLASDSEDVRES